MKERIKSVLLFLLVLCSLFLTQQLWFGRRPAEMTADSGYEPVYFEEPRPLAQMIIPEAICLYSHGQCYRVRPGDSDFNLFWEKSSTMLQELAEPGYYYYEDELPPQAERCFLLRFAPPLPLGPESIWLKERRSGELTGIEVWRVEERCWAILEESTGGSALLLLPPGWSAQLALLHDSFVPSPKQLCEELPAGELRLSREVAVNLTAPLSIPVGVSSLKRLSLKPEQLDRELLLKTFFINRNLVREIKEKDGGLIYTDGEQGLRLWRGLDYSHPRLEQKTAGLDYTAALLTAGKLISYHGGWVKNLHLQSLIEGAGEKDGSGGGYQAQWRTFFDGYPLLGDSGVLLCYHHGGLQSYRRNLYEPLEQPGDGVAVEEFRNALLAAVMLLEGDAVRPVLERMDLAYFLEGEEAVPVWQIHLDGRELLLKTDELVPPEGWES